MRLETNKPVLMAGDIHGNIDIMKKVITLGQKLGGNTVFVGDYVDSYPNTRAQQKECLEIAKEFHEKDNFHFLRGNHELNYQNHEEWPCSGYAKSFHRDISSTINSIDFENYAIVNDFLLISHAGFSFEYIGVEFEAFPFDLSDKEKLDFISEYIDAAVKSLKHNIYSVGRDSGGFHKCGGIFWCRPKNFTAFGNRIVQVFGHTKSNNIRMYPQERAYNIDCLEFPDANHQVLLYLPENNHSFKILQL